MNPKQIQFSELKRLKKDRPGLVVDDRIDLAIDELYDIVNPAEKDHKSPTEVLDYGQELTNGDTDSWGDWIFYPWLNRVVHFPPKDELRSLRTSRNRNLVTAEEQAKLYNSTLLIVGMSVGSNIVEALVSQGIGGKLILVDMDIIEPSNLNRIRSPYHHVGLQKTEAISRKVWEIDPHIEIETYDDGLNEDNLAQIISDTSLDVIVDEMDDLAMKITLREAAKGRQIPVVMAADDGDNALLEVERYDIERDTEIFDGRIPHTVLARIKAGSIPRTELGAMIGRYFVGPEHIPLKMYESLMEVGKSLPSWPQLGSAAALSGLSVAYVIKKILLGQNVRAGRTLISLDEKLDLESLNEGNQKKLQKFQEIMTREDEDA